MLLIKLGVTSLLLLVVFSRIDINNIAQLLFYVDWKYILAAIFITILQTYILSWRWHRIVCFLDGMLEVAVAVRLSFLGVFMNQVLPTSIGGDVFRVWGAHRHGLISNIGFSSVVIDRVTGLLSLSMVVTIASLFVWSDLNDGLLRFTILSSSVMILALIVFCTVGVGQKYRFLNHHIVKLMNDLASGMRKLLVNPYRAVEVLIVGALASSTGFLAVFVLSKSIGIDVSFFISAVFVGMVTLLAALPISIGGWGVRESAMVALFGIVGVPNEKSLLLSVLYGVVMMLASLPGGFLWWGGKGSLKSDSTCAQVGQLDSKVCMALDFHNATNKRRALGRIGFYGAKAINQMFRTELSTSHAWLYILLFLGLGISILLKGPVISLDSSTYVNHWPTRSPVYPFLLDIFDEHYHLLVLMQYITGVASIVFFCEKLKSIFIRTRHVSIMFFLLLILPYLPIDFLDIANLVGAESVSYSLFLLSTGYFIAGLYALDKRSIFLSCVILFILMLTRKQFVFLYPVYVLMLLLMRNKSKSLILICMVFVSYFGSNAIERVYNGITAGHFTGVPFTGIQLVVRPLWIARFVDADQFSGLEKEVFVSTLQMMDKNYVSLSSCKESALPIQCGYHHFLESYNLICWQILYPVLKGNGITDWWEIDRITLSISYKLIKGNLFTYLSEYYSAVKNGDGPYYMLFLLVVLILSLIDSMRYDKITSRVLLMVTMMCLANILLVSIVEPLLQRYTFYTSFLQIAVLVVFLFEPEKSKCVE
ncbi:flippase-like domain-containing protein [Methylomonas sp. SURF-2]|uniref:Flippase-like domain-containing protein n=1 Tax=Methylomonas subterranea TaxID=2952225 RepID=A0ABT1TCC1_9GAMM|nr:lysylphosphatidylglycerol synthase transmembrane domain-containing protein [Methylomonas sp. SURF-2]MCQ8103103.1 flippase-like domain-containing protein [Methylomonas sp. SURF-2]